jgi:hexosaminidase
MSRLVVPLSLVLLVLAFPADSADRSLSDLSVGPMSVSFNSGADGLSVRYGGVQVIRDSSLWVHNPTWTYHYYGYPRMRDDVQVGEVPGGKEAVLLHRSDSFWGEQRITVTPDQVVVALRYRLLRDVRDAELEYCAGMFTAAPLLGRPFRAVMTDGRVVEGTVPVRATSNALAQTLLAPGTISRLEVASRAGAMVLEVTGQPAGITIFDRRLSPYEPHDRAPVFWAGVLGMHLEYGQEYEQTVTLTVTPPAAPPAAAAPRATASAEGRPDLRAPCAGPAFVIPEPQQMTRTKGDFPFRHNTRIVVGDRAQPEDYRGAKSFAEEVHLLYGFTPDVITESQWDGSPAVLVGEPAINARLAAACAEAGLTAPEKEEGYALSVTPDRVLVVGHDRRGSYYGMQTLKQLLRLSPAGRMIEGCVIHDWPSLRFRGVHLFTGNQALPFHEKLIDRILSRYKINQLVLEVDYIKWRHDPALAVDFSEDQADIRKEIEYAREHFIEVTPLLQSLGHSEWLFTNAKNKDLAETPARPYTYCVSNPRTYDYVLPFYDEVIELFDHPKFVHIGHDEVQEPGGFPRDARCKQRGAERIFVDDTLKLHAHLAKAGARTMMWGDMLLAPGDSPDATNAASAESAKRVRDRLPKDIVITDWHYAAALPAAYKSVGMLKKEGFDTIAATWFTPGDIEAFSKQAKAVGALGLLQTTWAGFNSREECLEESFNQFSAMVLAAEYAWNSGKTDLDHLPYRWDDEFRRQWNPEVEDHAMRAGFVLDLTGAYNASLAGDAQGNGWLGLGPQYDLSAAPTGEVRLGPDTFLFAADTARPSVIRLASALDAERAYPKQVEIPVGRTAKSLLFVHTALWTDRGGRRTGAYRVHYADGTSEEIPLIYGANLVSWTDQRSVSGAARAWSGRTGGDQRVVLYRFQWDNPHPEKEIRSVEAVSDRTEAGLGVLAISGLE